MYIYEKYLKKHFFREIDLFDFTSFLGLEYLKSKLSYLMSHFSHFLFAYPQYSARIRAPRIGKCYLKQVEAPDDLLLLRP